MAVTNFSPLLGLALPTTGDLAGTWGTTVNDSITDLVDSAVAGTTTLSTDADVTLTTTNGAANQARNAVLLFTGVRTAQRTYTVPAQSKAYLVNNATTGGFSVKIVGSGPTTGVLIKPAEKATIFWNGSDFVKISTIDLVSSFSAGTTGLTPSTATTGAVTLAGTLDVTNGGTGLTTLGAGHIPYGQGTSAFLSSDDLSYDGATLRVGNQALLGGATNPVVGVTGSANGYIQTYIYNQSNSASSSSDIVAYASGSTDAQGWADMGFTSPAYSDASYSVTGPNEAYFFGSSTSASYTGNLVYATDSTGSANSHQWYVGGFAQAKSAWKMQLTSTGLQLANALSVSYGGTGATTASGARTALGATTLGANLFTITNPSAVTFPQFNADNTVSALSASAFRAAIGAGTGTGSGTVTSVNGTGTVNGITLTGTVTSAGDLTLGGTLSGVSLTTQVSGTLPVANGGTGLTAGTSGGVLYYSATGTLASSAALAASALVLGGGAGVAPATTTTGSGVVTALGVTANTATGFTTGSGTVTLTNKRIDPRVSTAASAASITPDVASFDQYCLTAQAAALAVNAPTGTPVNGTKLLFRFLDNGTARAITWNATYTVIGVTLPTTTVINKTVYIGCIYNAGSTRWDVIAVTTQA